MLITVNNIKNYFDPVTKSMLSDG